MADSFSGSYAPLRAWISAKFDINSATDVAYFVAPYSMVVRRTFVTVLDGNADTGTFTIDFDTVKSSNRPGLGEAGSVSKAGAASSDSKYYYEEPVSLVRLNPGDQIVVTVNAESGGAKTMQAGILYQESPETLANVANAIAG